MHFAAFVAAPCLGIVDAEAFADGGDVRLRDVGVGSGNLDMGVGARLCSRRHGVDEGAAAVGIYGVVTAVVGYEDTAQPVALRYARRDAEHDAIAEGHHGGQHIAVLVVPFRNGVSALEQRARKVSVHEVEVDGDVGDAEPTAVQGSKGQLTAVVVTAVIEGYCKCNVVTVVI